MRSLIVLAILTTAPAVHAMGFDVERELIAWNSDGTAALVSRTMSHERDRIAGFEVISADHDDLDAPISERLDSEATEEQIDVHSCEQAALQLQKTLARHHFGTVVVRPDRCNRDRSEILFVGAQPPQLPPIDLPELLSPECEQIQIVTRNLRLVLVFSTSGCGSPTRTSVSAFVPG